MLHHSQGCGGGTLTFRVNLRMPCMLRHSQDLGDVKVIVNMRASWFRHIHLTLSFVYIFFYLDICMHLHVYIYMFSDICIHMHVNVWLAYKCTYFLLYYIYIYISLLYVHIFNQLAAACKARWWSRRHKGCKDKRKGTKTPVAQGRRDLLVGFSTIDHPPILGYPHIWKPPFHSKTLPFTLW